MRRFSNRRPTLIHLATMTAPEAHALSPRQRRQVLSVLIPTSLIVVSAFVIAHNSSGPLATWLDNLHWTVAYLGGMVLAWLGVNWADPETAASKRCFAWGASFYFIGQLFWDLQIGLNWNPCPAPSDLFFWSMGPCCAYGVWLSYRRHRQPHNSPAKNSPTQSPRAMVLDAASCAVAVLTIALVMYLPRHSLVKPFELILLITYPVGMFMPTYISLIMIPALHLKFSWRWFLLFCVFVLNGAIWLQWNADVLNGSIGDGTWLNFCFSIVGICIGLGTVLWRIEPSTDPAWERRGEGLLRMLPLLVISAATLSVGLAWSLPRVSETVALSITLCAAVMFVLAIVRQSLLLYEREQLIAAEHRAGELEQSFRVLFYATRDGLALIDKSGRLLEMNPACSEIFGYSRRELLEMNFVQLICSDHSQVTLETAEATRQLIASSRSDLREGMFAHKGGQPLHLEVSSVAVPGSDGHLIVEFRDITARKASEVAHASLEAQLRQSQKLEAIGTLASGIAHDFNNILGVILGNIDLASVDSHRPHALQTSLQQARKAVHRARDLISRIVAFARPQESVREALQMSDVVEDALKLLRATLPPTVRIRSKLPAQLPLVLLDSSQIFQVLLNLCTNAYQAMDQQRGEIDVTLQSCEVTADSMSSSNTKAGLHIGRYVLLRVKDTGSGIDPAIAERIFEPFFTTKPVGQGSGLGLSMVHSIVRSHGGAITVDSALGHGTTFNIYLPTTTATHADIEPATAMNDKSGKGQHILCVDDEEALVFLLSRVLERWGYRVSGYTEPHTALAALQSGTTYFDLIITDLSMPGMSGMEFAREALRLQPMVPIVMISGYIQKNEIDAARAAGIKDILLKPDSVDELANTIHRLLSTEEVAS